MEPLLNFGHAIQHLPIVRDLLIGVGIIVAVVIIQLYLRQRAQDN